MTESEIIAFRKFNKKYFGREKWNYEQLYRFYEYMTKLYTDDFEDDTLYYDEEYEKACKYMFKED